MGRKSHLDIIATTGVIIVMLFFIYRYHAYVDIDPTVGGTLLRLLPGFIVIAVCVYVIAETSGVGKTGASIGLGIGLCYLVNAANVEGLITAEMLSGLTIPQVQIWIMIISTIMGAIIYASS